MKSMLIGGGPVNAAVLSLKIVVAINMLSEADFQTAANGICPGPDLEWFAVDERGNVGAFCNAGFASVPRSVFSSYRLYVLTLDSIALLQKNGDALWSWVRP
ncbi:MAG: hypothetical protein KDA87_25505, partial [Planctomycetales bacterium]|nr:hypothetical protein [Planctomycetales bacterium]